MFYPGLFPKHSIETFNQYLNDVKAELCMPAFGKYEWILLQTFVWIVDLKVREHLTEYLKKDIKYHR